MSHVLGSFFILNSCSKLPFVALIYFTLILGSSDIHSFFSYRNFGKKIWVLLLVFKFWKQLISFPKWQRPKVLLLIMENLIASQLYSWAFYLGINHWISGKLSFLFSTIPLIYMGQLWWQGKTTVFWSKLLSIYLGLQFFEMKISGEGQLLDFRYLWGYVFQLWRIVTFLLVYCTLIYNL